MEPNDQQGNEQFRQPQVVKPEDMFNPSLTVQPPAQAEQAPQPSVSQDFPPVQDNGLKKRIIIALGGLAGLFILAIVIILIVSSGGKKGGQGQADQGAQISGILNPPSAIDIENANNSISSDITGLNDDNDFPTVNLTDDNLQL